MSREIRPEIREFVLKRDKYTCRYCGNNIGPFHLDHVYPLSKGGETSVENLVTSCETCNTRKHAKIGIFPKPIGYFKFIKKFEIIHSAGMVIGSGFLLLFFIYEIPILLVFSVFGAGLVFGVFLITNSSKKE